MKTRQIRELHNLSSTRSRQSSRLFSSQPIHYCSSYVFESFLPIEIGQYGPVLASQGLNCWSIPEMSGDRRGTKRASEGGGQMCRSARHSTIPGLLILISFLYSRDFVKGTCFRGDRCKFEHPSKSSEEVKDRIPFCTDYRQVLQPPPPSQPQPPQPSSSRDTASSSSVSTCMRPSRWRTST